MNTLMIREDHSGPTGRCICQEHGVRLAVGTSNVATPPWWHRAAASLLCAGHVLLRFGFLRGGLCWLVCPFFFLSLGVLFWSRRSDCQLPLSSENTLKQIVLFPCAEQDSELRVINFIDTVWNKKMLMRVQGCEKIEISECPALGVGKFQK